MLQRRAGYSKRLHPSGVMDNDPHRSCRTRPLRVGCRPNRRVSREMNTGSVSVSGYAWLHGIAREARPTWTRGTVRAFATRRKPVLTTRAHDRCGSGMPGSDRPQARQGLSGSNPSRARYGSSATRVDLRSRMGCSGLVDRSRRRRGRRPYLGLELGSVGLAVDGQVS